MRLRPKLTLLISTLVLGVLLLAGAIQLAFEWRTVRAAQRLRQQGKASALAEAAAEAFSQASDSYLKRLASAVARDEALTGVTFVDADGSPIFRVLETAGRAEDRFEVPVVDLGVRLGALRAGFDASANRREARSVVLASARRLLAVALLALGAGLLAAALLADHLARPLRELALRARRVGAGDFHMRASERRPDELGDLAADFDRMAEKLGEVEALKQRFLEAMTHDLRNPLVPIHGYLELMLSGALGPVAEEHKPKLQVMLENADKLSRLIEDMVTLTRLESGLRELELSGRTPEDAAAEAVGLCWGAAKGKGVELEARLAPGLQALPMDRALVERALADLVLNAVERSPNGKTVLVAAALEGGRLRFSITDSGPALPPELAREAFSKFGKRGAGVGLSLCKAVARAHGGDAWADGSTFFFTLPLAAQSKRGAESAS